MKKTSLIIASLLGLLLLSGCATEMALRQAHSAYSAGKLEESLAVLQQARAENPTDPQLRAAYLTLRDDGIQKILAEADQAKQSGASATAQSAYERVLRIDRDNIRAKNGLLEIERAQRHTEILAKVKDDLKKNETATAAEQLRLVLTEQIDNPDAKTLQQEMAQKSAKEPKETKISKALQKTLSIDFKDALLKQVFEVFSRTTGVNFVFDKDIKSDQKVTLFLKGTSVREALDVVMFTNQLEQRVLDTNTILIYPNTPAKQKDYQPLTVRGFFLANADPEQLSAALKSLLKMKDVVVDKRQNLITVRDTQDAVKMAEKLVTLYDLPEPEVMLEVEILEINRTRLTELGIKYPNQLTLTPLAASGGSTVTLRDLRSVSENSLGASVTPAVINARRETADINLLANPRIRVRNRDTAKILIGDKVPTITTTSTATGFVGTNVQYLDVGLKLEVVPTISVDNEVAIKISLEVSNIANQTTTTGGTIAYQIGTRSASTVLRLKDGENQVLAGLINDEDRHSASKIPGLGDIPLLGRLFGSNLNDGKRSEIVLSITPRLVRNNLRPDLSILEFESGTESGLRTINTGGTDKSRDAATTTDSGNIPAGSKALPPSVPATLDNKDSSAATTSAIRWDAPAQVKPGDTFSVRLNLSAGQPITGIPLAIAFDPAKLEIINVQEGSLLSQGGAKTSFSQRVDRSSGRIYMTTTRNPTDGSGGATGEGTLVTLTAKAASGPSEAFLSIIAISPLGPNGVTVPVDIPAPVSINISQ